MDCPQCGEKAEHIGSYSNDYVSDSLYKCTDEICTVVRFHE